MANQTRLSPAEHLALGVTAGLFGQTANAPLERVKFLLQSQHEIVKAGRLDRPYVGVIDCIVRTYKTEGLFMFWRGNVISCVSSFPTQAINFAVKGTIQRAINANPDDSVGKKLLTNVATGGAAGALSLLLVYHFSFVRTRLATDVKVLGAGPERQFNGSIDVYRKILKSDGIVGLNRGFVVSCVGIIVYRGAYFGLYDTLKPVVIGDNARMISAFLLGYCVTITAGLISYPLDTVRVRMLMRSGEPVKYKGSIDCFRQIVKNDGVTSLWRGASISILRSIAGAGLLVGYDHFKNLYVAMRLKN